MRKDRKVAAGLEGLDVGGTVSGKLLQWTLKSKPGRNISGGREPGSRLTQARAAQANRRSSERQHRANQVRLDRGGGGAGRAGIG